MGQVKQKAAIYCRLSEEDKDKQSNSDDSISIQNQKSMLLKYAQEQDWEVYRIYSDDDYAGADRRRPEFRRLLEDAKNRKFDIILCKTQSRFTRELELVEKYIHGCFPIWGIRFVSVVDNADTAMKGNKKSRQINGLVNEWYLEDMSDNIRSVLNNRRENGLHIGASALYGYRKDPDKKGHLIIDEEAAFVVQEVFTLFSQGYGKTAIARILNDRGIPNPAEYKRQHNLDNKHPKDKNSTLWKYSAISAMLSNEMYTGTMVQGKYGSESYKTKKNRPRPREQWYRVEGTHEPVINRQLWDRVQKIRGERAKPFKEGKRGVFAGKARCMYCGYTMRSSTVHEKRYLKCGSRYAHKDACMGSFIPVDSLEQAVSEELDKISAEYLDRDKLQKEVRILGDPVERIAGLNREKAACERKYDGLAKDILGLYKDKARGILTEEDYCMLSKEFHRERDRVAGRIQDVNKKITEVKQQMGEKEGSGEILEQYIRSGRLSREVVEEMIDVILVGKRDPLSKCVPVEIHWNF